MRARKSLLIVVFVIAVLLAACEHHQTIAYPKMVPEAGAVEASFDCPRLEDAILKTEAVRWVMREDGARLLTPNERAMRTSADTAYIVASTFACLFCVPMTVLRDEGHHSLDGVDHRLLSLLKLKGEKDCAPSPSGLPGMTDLQMHDSLTALIAREGEKPSDDDMKALLAERMRLLDHLRP